MAFPHLAELRRMNVQGVGDGIGKMPPLALDAVSNSYSRSAIKTWWAAANIDQGGTVKPNWPFAFRLV